MIFAKRLTTLLVILAFAILIVGCGGGTPSSTQRPTVPPAGTPPPAAPTASISANPSTIVQGGSATLTWQTTNATDINIDVMGAVQASGSQSVMPATSTTYTLTAKGAGGTQTAMVTITVTAPPPPPPVPNADISGSWEFVKASNYSQDDLDPCAGCFFTSQEELVETVISQQDGVFQGNQTMPITVAFFAPTIPNDWSQAGVWVGGLCNGDPGNSSMTGTVAGNAVTFTVDENGLSFSGTGTVNPDGSISGTYITTSSSGFCLDSGVNFTAHKTSPLTGALSTSLFGENLDFGINFIFNNYHQGPVDSNGVPSLDMIGSTEVDGSFNFTGIAVGNLGIVDGQFMGHDQPAKARVKAVARPRASYPGKVFSLIVPHANFSNLASDETLAIIMGGFQPVFAGNDRVAVTVFNEQ